MDVRFIAGVCVLLAAGVAGCSSPDPAPRPAGSLPPGTAEVSIDGEGRGRTYDVSCATTGTLTSINTGDEKSGTTSSIDNTDGLSVQFGELQGHAIFGRLVVLAD